MKKFTLFIICLVAIIIATLLTGTSGEKSVQLVSPLIKNERVLGVNLWFPSFASNTQSDNPEISAQAALFIESNTGQTFYAKNADIRLPIASLVKGMTALIALERKSLDDQYVVSQRAAKMEPDKMLLIEGERLTLKELLYGVFLISANDASEVLAEGTTGDEQSFSANEQSSSTNREEFINLMNAKAQQLGMNDTYFANPTGLDEEENNSYSSARDLAILTRYLIKSYPMVVEISQTPHIFIPSTIDHQDYEMYSGINLLTTYPGVVGFKTGYTPKAGYTIISLARKKDYEVIGVLLDSKYRKDEVKLLLDYSFAKLGR